MKFTLAMSALLTFAKAADNDDMSKWIDAKYGSCNSDPCATTSECCHFEYWENEGKDKDISIGGDESNPQVIINENDKDLKVLYGGKFCMTDT